MCLCLLLTVRSDYSWVMCIPEHPFRKEYIRGCGLEFLCISWIHWRPKQHFIYLAKYTWASQVAQTVKNPPAMPETWFWSLGQEDPLEKGMVTHSSIAWRIPWTEEPGAPQSMRSQSQTRLKWLRTHACSSSWILCIISIPSRDIWILLAL